MEKYGTLRQLNIPHLGLLLFIKTVKKNSRRTPCSLLAVDVRVGAVCPS